MVMEVCALASGSSGNCFYVGNGKGGILIDAGISAKQICLRMQKRELQPEKIKGIFVTHEHIDHVRGIDVFARNFNVPVFATQKTAAACFLCDDTDLIRVIRNTEEVVLVGMFIVDFFFLESNHDELMLRNGGYPEHLKKLILSDIGHLSNRQAGLCVLEHASP